MKEELMTLSDLIAAHHAEIAKLEAEYSALFVKYVVEVNDRKAMLTYAQVARMLGLDIRTLRNMMHKGEFASLRVKKGKQTMIRYGDVADILFNRNVKRGSGQLLPDRRAAVENLLKAGEHTVEEIAELFGIAPRTVFRVQKVMGERT